MSTSNAVEARHDAALSSLLEGSGQDGSVRFRQQEKIMEVLKQDAQRLLKAERGGGRVYEAFDVPDGVRQKLSLIVRFCHHDHQHVQFGRIDVRNRLFGF